MVLGISPPHSSHLLGSEGPESPQWVLHWQRQLGWHFVELDHLIVDRAGVSLAEIFEQGGRLLPLS